MVHHKEVGGDLLKFKTVEASSEACAWVPCHISCFFEVREHEDSLRTGSRGSGLNLALGVKTKVKVFPHDGIEVSGGNDGSREVATRILESLGIKARVEISHESSVPVGVGYGVSGATALGSALSLSVALGGPLSLLEAGAVAHVVEVEQMTGLGDVIAQIHGGIEIRLREGAPGIGLVDWIPHEQDLRVVSAAAKTITTREMLESKREAINRSGFKALLKLLKKPTVQELMLCAQGFADDVGFMDDFKDLAKLLLDEGAIGASVKKGVVYAVTRKERVEGLCELMKRHLKGRQVFSCPISDCGPKVTLIRRSG